MTAFKAFHSLWRIAIPLLFLGAILSLTERLILVNGSHYPTWLSTGSFETLAPGSLGHLRISACGGNQPIEIFQNKDQWIFRCGLFWPSEKTFTAPRSAGNDRIVNSPQDF